MSSPSPWIQRWASHWAPSSTVLDLACGAGRHANWLYRLGLAVTGVDRDPDALALLSHGVEPHLADLEVAPWPWPGRVFDVVLVTNYLWRPLFPFLVSSVAPGGWLIYETFADGQQHLGRPRNPDFLLQSGELLRVCQSLHVLAYEDGVVNGSRIQHVAARRLESSQPLLESPVTLKSDP
jgi:SAM-dependent methyltransferase